MANVLNFKLHLCVIFLMFGSLINSSTGYLPQTLSSEANKSKFYLDPSLNIFINPNIHNKTKRFLDSHGIDLRVFVIKAISSEYNVSPNNSKKNIEKFTSELSKFLYSTKLLNSKSLTILLSIDDRQIRIRTGREVKVKVSDKQLLDVLNKHKHHFKVYDYDKGLNAMIDNIYKIITGEKNSIESSSNTMRVIYSIFFIVLVLIASNKSSIKKKTDEDAIERLKKLKKELNKKKPKKEFLNTTCIICIEEFDENKKLVESQKKETTESIESKNEIKKCNSSSNEIKEEKLLKGKTTLDCGHKFHDNCIKDWIVKENTCPTCRTKIDSLNEDNSPKFTEQLVNVQTVFYPSLSSTPIEYLLDDIIWTTTPTQNVDNSNDNYDCGDGASCGSGGASGDW